MPEILSGANFLAVYNAAVGEAGYRRRTVCLYQLPDGSFAASYYMPAEDPYLAVHPDGSASLHCEHCEFDGETKGPDEVRSPRRERDGG
jgi:hypothetical protein